MQFYRKSLINRTFDKSVLGVRRPAIPSGKYSREVQPSVIENYPFG